MPEEYDKLAWGLVKEEIRLLNKSRPDKIEKIVADTLRPNDSYYRSSLSELKQKLLRRKLVEQFKTDLRGFSHTTGKARLEERGPTTPTDSMFFWEHCRMGVTELGKNERHHEESYLDLKHLNLSVGRKKMVADWTSCFVIVNEHTLYRMIQRNLVHREPLKYLGEHLEEWFKYANVFMLAHHLMGGDLGHNIFIPFGKGALLAKMSFTETHISQHGWGFHDMRFIDGVKGRNITPTPYDSLISGKFQDKEGSSTLYISTWIPEAYFHSEQWWAKFRIEEFINKHSNVVRFCNMAMTDISRAPREDEVRLMEGGGPDFGLDLGKILHDRRWGIACNW